MYRFIPIRDNELFANKAIRLYLKNKETMLFDYHPQTDDGIAEMVMREAVNNKWFLACLDENLDFIGMYLFNDFTGNAENIHSCNCHITFERKYRNQAAEASIQLAKYMFDEVGVFKLYAPVPEFNAIAHGFLRKLGFTLEYVAKENNVKHGKLINEYTFSLKKEQLNG